MIQRTALEKLRNWTEKPNRKPLVLRGARQVGKTTLIDEFSRDFDTYLYLNLENKSAKALFDNQTGTDELLTAIYLFCNKRKSAGRALLFIDEIQNSPEAVAQLRYFYEQKPVLYVIAAGSLLESLINKRISFPVGRVEYMALRPCSFVEYLDATGADALKQAVESCEIPEAIHQKTAELFNTYTLIGGMPEVVANYAVNRDIVALRDIYESLLNGFMDDVEKYSTNQTMTNVLKLILSIGWKYAAEKIKFQGFAESAYRSREVGEAFRLLEKTLLIELVYPAKGFSAPILPDYKKAPKLIWVDTGLVNYVANIQKAILGATDIFDAWRGRIAEQIAAQEILASDHRVSFKRHYWVRDKKGASSELDFVFQHEHLLIPVEVKSGHNAKLKSLHVFMERTHHDIAVRIWNNPFDINDITTPGGKKFRLFNIPFYYTSNIGLIINKYG